ncbi:aminoglycoside phosphotransferase [Xylogone sp. PMI_703]|nr:aminoglycoside phosphotransferase [Xylogone sp. PMI_703]
MPAPSQDILDAFECTEPARALSGGQNQSYKSGIAVLKPVDDIVEAEWTAEVFTQLSASPIDGFRVPAPIRASNSRFTYRGWAAYRFHSGVTGPRGKWKELVEISRLFHAALQDVERPFSLENRSHPWAIVDRVAWEEEHRGVTSRLEQVYQRLCNMRREVRMTYQIIHGDLSGNVLFASDGAPPTVIDFSPFWRPVEYSEAILAVDGILYFGEGEELVALCHASANQYQMLVRASIFRLVARSGLIGLLGEVAANEIEDFERLVSILLKMEPKGPDS